MITVRGAALRAKLNALRWLQNGSYGPTGQARASAIKKTDTMVIWPLGYLKLDALIFWVIAAVLTLILYRIGLFVAGVVSFSLSLRLMKRLLQPGKIDTPDGEP
jgi:hypothetical protein